MNQERSKATILAVDDTPTNIDVVKGVLSQTYIVQAAINGKMALKIIERQKPDLILLDIMMPDMDGYEVCRRLKADPETREIPIIFLTAKTSQDAELEGLELGAVDYITKPFSPPIVQARVKTHLALREANRHLGLQNRQLQNERELIENILLKMRSANAMDERFLRSLVSPVEETAGDMLLSAFAPDGRQLVLLGDFTGHGLPAAIGGPLVDYILHQRARRNDTGEATIREINSQLHARLPTGIFFAATLVEITPDRAKATIWGAALPEVLLIRDGKLHQSINSTLPPLGVLETMDFAESSIEVALQKDDRLCVFSDGIIEASPPNGPMFGVDRLASFLCKAISEQKPLAELISILASYTGSSLFDDDITLVEIQT
ncbi:MAG: SpoIIE family protein phosphatase [Magnetococcales bacterium]|nr:SpoIIE family protein phosphatase [Magnetococcales bacterium]